MEENSARSAVVASLLADLIIPIPRWQAPVLIGVFGLPGTGKTHVARRLADRYPLALLTTDVIRQRYGLASGPATHAVMYELAATLLPRRHPPRSTQPRGAAALCSPTRGSQWDHLHDGGASCGRGPVARPAG